MSITLYARDNLYNSAHVDKIYTARINCTLIIAIHGISSKGIAERKMNKTVFKKSYLADI